MGLEMWSGKAWREGVWFDSGWEDIVAGIGWRGSVGGLRISKDRSWVLFAEHSLSLVLEEEHI